MRAFTCSRCDALVNFEDKLCVTCGSTLGYVPDGVHMYALDPDGSVTLAVGPDDGDSPLPERWVQCVNVTCNWLRRETAASDRCDSCRLTIERPGEDDPIALEQLALAGAAKRRLLFQLREHALPVRPHYEHENGLGFRLISSASGQPVTIGHADGVVTIDLKEVDHAYRESLRVRLGEPYRTMLGHFRHEIGHYYWQVLIAESPDLDRFRAVFGDERASYADALERHYQEGAPADWGDRFISEYATMHPWEDWAETWAHYLHITDTLQTVASYGIHLDGVTGYGVARDDHRLATATPLPTHAYHEMSMNEILDLWHPLSYLFNQVNRSMGKNDLYPFVITQPVRGKLAFVHEVVSGRRAPG